MSSYFSSSWFLSSHGRVFAGSWLTTPGIMFFSFILLIHFFRRSGFLLSVMAPCIMIAWGSSIVRISRLSWMLFGKRDPTIAIFTFVSFLAISSASTMVGKGISCTAGIPSFTASMNISAIFSGWFRNFSR